MDLDITEMSQGTNDLNQTPKNRRAEQANSQGVFYQPSLGRFAADVLDVEVFWGAVEVGEEGWAEPEFEGGVGRHVGGAVSAAVELRAEVSGVQRKARNG